MLGNFTLFMPFGQCWLLRRRRPPMVPDQYSWRNLRMGLLVEDERVCTLLLSLLMHLGVNLCPSMFIYRIIYSLAPLCQPRRFMPDFGYDQASFLNLPLISTRHIQKRNLMPSSRHVPIAGLQYAIIHSLTAFPDPNQIRLFRSSTTYDFLYFGYLSVVTCDGF
jgi:hypothetical protein